MTERRRYRDKREAWFLADHGCIWCHRPARSDRLPCDKNPYHSKHVAGEAPATEKAREGK